MGFRHGKGLNTDMQAQRNNPLSGLVTAMRTLTILPIPGHETAGFGAAHAWFPVAGALVGGLLALAAAGVWWIGRGWSEAAALTVVGGAAVLTSGLHLDGLADWADSFGARTPERRLAIMKDSHMGAYGVIALIVMLLGKWAALDRMIDAGGWLWIPAAFVLSRTMQVVLASRHPYARVEGGTGHPFVTEATGRRAGIAVLIALALVVLLVRSVTGLLLAAGGAAGLTLAFGAWCRRRVGGVTGDLLGTCSELVELWVLVCGAVLLS
jgi:adenosylcobinamide-GDP ribazoletransferase